jgi:hypothetical protein
MASDSEGMDYSSDPGALQNTRLLHQSELVSSEPVMRSEADIGYPRAIYVIELLGGEVAERILHPERRSLGAKHDFVEANVFARIAFAASPAVAALLAYCEAEAAALIRANTELSMAWSKLLSSAAS